MMIAEGISKILDISKANLLMVNGRDYSDKPLHAIKDPVPDPVKIDTLTGIADYLNANPDGLSIPEGVVLVIDSPKVVRLVSPTTQPWLTRRHFLTAEADNPSFPFGRYMSLEEMIIALQTVFVRNDAVDLILSNLGNVTDADVRTLGDDGTSQEITRRVGIQRAEKAVLPKLHMLAPYRTFNEVEQPECQFILRLQSGVAKQGDGLPTAALFEADGGAWRMAARKFVFEWLREHVPAGIPILS